MYKMRKYPGCVYCRNMQKEVEFLAAMAKAAKRAQGGCTGCCWQAQDDMAKAQCVDCLLTDDNTDKLVAYETMPEGGCPAAQA